MNFETWANKARAVPIEDEIARRSITLRGGIDRCGPCPVCGGDDRFSINIAKQVWNCRGCDKGGNVIELVRHLDGSDFVAAVTALVGERPKLNGSGDALRAAIAKKRAKSEEPKEPATEIVAASFTYENEDGSVAYVIKRIEFQKADGALVLKDGKRRKTFKLDPVGCTVRIPYRLPQLVEAVASGHLVFVAEGERKCDVLADIGIAATCNPFGAGSWKAEYSERLRGADVVLLPDADEAGWKHMNEVAASLVGIAARIRVVMLPDLPEKGDVVDWLGSGHTREELDALVAGAQDWRPPSEEARSR